MPDSPDAPGGGTPSYTGPASSSPSSSSMPPATSPSPAPVAPAVPARRRRGPWVAVAVIVVVIIIILVSLWVFGYFPGVAKPGSSSTASSQPVSYSQARTDADQKVSSSGGGSGYKPLFVIGVDSPSSKTETTTNATQSGCTLTPWNGQSAGSSVTLSSYSGSLGSGVSPFWVFFYTNGAGAYIIVGVLGGSAKVFGQVTGSNCFPSFGTVSITVPSDVIDSPAAVQAALGAGGSVFLSNHTGVSMTMTLIGGVVEAGINLGAQWAVEMSTCPALGSSSSVTGDSFEYIVNATSGSVFEHSSSYAHAC
jgi:hypothetical protein